MQSIEEVIFLCSFLKELAPFSCSLSHILMSASRFRRLTDHHPCHNVFNMETLLSASESALISPKPNVSRKPSLVCGTQEACISDLFWNLHFMLGVRSAFFKANWNYILFPEDQNIFDEIALKIVTKPDGLAPFPFANRTQFDARSDHKRTSLKKSFNRHDDKLKAETKFHTMAGTLHNSIAKDNKPSQLPQKLWNRWQMTTWSISAGFVVFGRVFHYGKVVQFVLRDSHGS